MVNIDINLIEFSEANSNFINIKYLGKPITFFTPEVYVPFGIENQYNNYLFKIQLDLTKKNNLNLYNFIIKLEEKINEYINDNIKSQVRVSKKYRPLLTCKIPYSYGKIQCNIKNINNENLNIFKLDKTLRMKCQLVIDKIYKFKDSFYYKIKTNEIIII